MNKHTVFPGLRGGLFVVACVMAVLNAGACSSDTPAGQASREQRAWRWIENGAIVIDVRTESEFARGHLDNALLIPYDQIASRTAEFDGDKDRHIVLYCRSGRRSSIAKKTLDELGFTNVLNAGGFKDILAARKATEKSSSAGDNRAPSRSDVANASYQGIYERAIRLADGRYEGEPFAEGGASRPTVQLITDIYEHADLNGDGSEEAVVVLGESSGGSGSNLYLAVVSQPTPGMMTNVGTSLIGDRVQIRSVRINGTHIELDVVQQDSDDAACCPTQKATRRWQLGSYGLVEKPPTIHGTVSLNDLMGVEWVLTHLGRGESVPDNVEITLTFEEGRIGGSSGCNRYFATVTETSPGEIKVSETGATRMACPEARMDLETRYLSALGGVVKFSFLPNKLALTSMQDDQVRMLLFRARKQTAD